MNNRVCFVLLVVMSISFNTYSQARFISEGKFEFERRINVHRQMESNEDDSWLKEMLSKTPTFYSSMFSLQFTNSNTTYQPVGEEPDFKFPWMIGPAKTNSVRTDFSKGSQVAVKTVFEEQYIVENSVRQIKWKISDEQRTIAGFNCRKAVGIICDSVYVVAFFAEEIPVSGGPESFAGLPGMILGLVVPRLHTTWFATKLTLQNSTTANFPLPRKGKKTTEPELHKLLQSSMKEWGDRGQKNMWWAML